MKRRTMPWDSSRGPLSLRTRSPLSPLSRRSSRGVFFQERSSGSSISETSFQFASFANFTAAAATSRISNSSARFSTTERYLPRSDSLTRISWIELLVRSSLFACTSVAVGTESKVIFLFVKRSMFLSKRLSRGSKIVIAVPSLPARPVLPIRWT